MASLARLGRSFIRPLVAKNSAVSILLPRALASTWNKDWKPGPYPRTPAERAAAAKKYNLRLEDYEPYPDDGFGYGDYPKLPTNAPDSRDPYENWDIPEQKRNYGEPIHVDIDKMVEDKYNPDMVYRYSWLTMWGMMVGVIGGILVLYYVTLPYPHFHPAMKKQNPKEKGAHYTFEQVD